MYARMYASIVDECVFRQQVFGHTTYAHTQSRIYVLHISKGLLQIYDDTGRREARCRPRAVSEAWGPDGGKARSELALQA